MVQKERDLKREISLIGLSSIIINTVIGAGIFVLPGIVAEKLGSASILAYVFCGILITLIMLCFAEVGSKITATGGAYIYIERTFGKFPGFLAALLIPFSTITADAAIANAIVNIAFKLYPPIDSEIVRILFFLFLFSSLAFINVRGVRKGVAFVKLITIIKIAPLLLIVFIGFKDVDYSNLYWESFPSIKNIGATSLILYFAFTGAGSALAVSGEVKNPQRTIPRAILFSVFIVGVIYVMVQTVSQGVLGSDLPLNKENPLGEVASYIFGPIGFTLLTIGAAVSMFGGISSKVLSVPRVLFAASKDAIIPLKVLAKVHPKYATPYVSIISYTSLSFLLAILGGFQYLAVLSSTSGLLIALGIALSVIKLRREEKQVANPKTFRIPGGYTVPVLAIIVIFWFLSNLSTEKQIGLSVLIGILSLLYFIINGNVFWKGKNSK